jgi:hypothetical protein
VRGVGSWTECRELSLPQLREAVAACDRRDAALAMQALDTAHAANAPFHAGREGVTMYDKTVAFLRSVIDRTPVEKNSVFKQLKARALRK